jgi:hypothetical protein
MVAAILVYRFVERLRAIPEAFMDRLRAQGQHPRDPAASEPDTRRTRVAKRAGDAEGPTRWSLRPAGLQPAHGKCALNLRAAISLQFNAQRKLFSLSIH